MAHTVILPKANYTMKKLILTLIAIFAIATPFYLITAADAREQAIADAHQNAEANARYILSQNITDATFDAQITAMHRSAADKMNKNLKPLGGELIDPMAFMEAWAGKPIDAYFATARDVGTALYLDVFTPKQLAEIATFYRSDAGRAVLAVVNNDAATDASSAEQEIDWIRRISLRHYISFYVFSEGKTGQRWREVHPIISERVDENLVDASAVFRESMTMDAVIDLIARDDMVTFDHPDMRDYVVGVMRGEIEKDTPMPTLTGYPRVAETE